MRPMHLGGGIIAVGRDAVGERVGESADADAVVEGYDWLVEMTSGHEADAIIGCLSSFDNVEWLLRTLGETLRSARDGDSD